MSCCVVSCNLRVSNATPNRAYRRWYRSAHPAQALPAHPRPPPPTLDHPPTVIIEPGRILDRLAVECRLDTEQIVQLAVCPLTRDERQGQTEEGQQWRRSAKTRVGIDHLVRYRCHARSNERVSREGPAPPRRRPSVRPSSSSLGPRGRRLDASADNSYDGRRLAALPRPINRRTDGSRVVDRQSVAGQGCSPAATRTPPRAVHPCAVASGEGRTTVMSTCIVYPPRWSPPPSGIDNQISSQIFIFVGVLLIIK